MNDQEQSPEASDQIVEPTIMKVDTGNGEVAEVRVGYQLRPNAVPYSDEAFTHRLAVRLRLEAPHWFRNNVIRGWYELDNTYWS